MEGALQQAIKVLNKTLDSTKLCAEKGWWSLIAVEVHCLGWCALTVLCFNLSTMFRVEGFN